MLYIHEVCHLRASIPHSAAGCHVSPCLSVKRVYALVQLSCLPSYLFFYAVSGRPMPQTSDASTFGRDLPCVCLMCYSYSCRAVLVSFIQACICLPQTPTTLEIACCGVSHEISPGMFIECWTMFYRVILTPTM